MAEAEVLLGSVRAFGFENIGGIEELGKRYPPYFKTVLSAYSV
jgi:hypothetical protein